jgi:hypothetical protein
MSLQAAALVQQQGIVGAAGCAVGALTAAAMMTAMIQVRRCSRIRRRSTWWWCRSTCQAACILHRS